MLFASSNGRRAPRLAVCPSDASCSQLFADSAATARARGRVAQLVVGGNGARPTNPCPCPISARPLLPPSFHFGRWIQGVVAARMNASTHQHSRLSSRALRAHQLRQLIASSCCSNIIPQLADEACVLAAAAPYCVHCRTALLLTPRCRSLYRSAATPSLNDRVADRIPMAARSLQAFGRPLY